MSLLNRSIGIVLTSTTVLLTSLVISITNDFISKIKLRFTKLRDWISFITILYEKTLNQSMIGIQNRCKRGTGTEKIKQSLPRYLKRKI